MFVSLHMDSWKGFGSMCGFYGHIQSTAHSQTLRCRLSLLCSLLFVAKWFPSTHPTSPQGCRFPLCLTHYKRILEVGFGSKCGYVYMDALIQPSTLTSSMLGFPLFIVSNFKMTWYAHFHPFIQPTSPRSVTFLYTTFIAHGFSKCDLDQCTVSSICTHSFIHLSSPQQC